MQRGQGRLGSLLGFLIFIYGGNYFIGTINAHQDIINWIIGGILSVTAIMQIYRLKRPTKSTSLSKKRGRNESYPIGKNS